MQRLVMVVSLIYLSLVHLHRIYFDYGSYTLDITGPLMVITQKVTLLTFSIHDGIARNENELTKSQKMHAIRTLPTALEFFSYSLHFQGLMAGPLVFYKDYIDFIEGTSFLKHTNGNVDKSGNKIVVEPSPTKAVVKKVIGSVVCAYIFMSWITVYPIKRLSEDDFIENTPFFYKMWYIMMATTTIRFKYYHAWLLADAICNNSGLGFNGYEKDGNPKWDLISNINVISFELATNMRDAINNWNLGTNQWLRIVVYERVPKKYGTFLTFGLSSLWHGFYAGYYLTFASAALIVESARTARKLFRHRFQQSESSRIFYDILTVLTTRVFMGYLTFPFILLEFKTSLSLYLNLFMCLHIVGLIMIYVLPHFIRGERSQKSNAVTAPTLNGFHNASSPTSGTNSNGVVQLNGVQSNGVNSHQSKTKIVQSNNAHNNEQFVDYLPNNSNQCDINVNTENKLDDDTTNGDNGANGSTTDSASTATDCNNSLSNNDTQDYRQPTSTDQHLSKKIRERIDSETRYIEEFIDKTVTGIVELKEDLMRVNQDDIYASGTSDDGLRKRNLSDMTNGKEIETFLRKEINNANVLPAVLSNGHAD
ncbi:lysophospholipid acyltransferase 6 isoform X2 [Sitodiplosis mosellana]|nr:lysophospholipid acyltransferase 6 isoform X2 [Sitodiplosis mosellana]